MIWLVPIGFLGLLGVVALIVIYVIKPNYQNKLISSTYVWRLSLKYKKKRLPVNKLQNILQFICQLLILTICGLLLAQPVLAATESTDPKEKVIIIDASASMRIESNGGTRFERAIEEAKTLAETAFTSGSKVSVIVADASPDGYLVRKQLTSEDSALLYEALDSLECTYGTADIETAVDLADDILDINNDAKVYLITARSYLNSNKIEIVPVSHEDDWNAAVLGITAKMDENNHYEFKVNVGCYGRTEAVSLNLVIHGANHNSKNPGKKISIQKPPGYFDPSLEEQEFVFNSDDFGSEPITSYDYIEAYISSDDSFTDDNIFFLYGGKRPTIKIQYASSKPNLFFGGIIRTMRQNMREKWSIVFNEVKRGDEPATEGYDIYIFEHSMPETLPTDGVVLLVNPDVGPKGTDLVVGDTKDTKDPNETLASGVAHELMKYVDPGRISMARYKEILSAPGYEELAYYNGKPVILAKEDDGEKVIVWAFDLHHSNLIAIPDFSFMMYNLFNYFVPATMSSTTYEIGDTVELKARGTNLTVVGVEDFNGQSLHVTTPGTYTVTQRPMQGDELIIESFHVHIPNGESDITEEIDELPILSYEKQTGIDFSDLIFYFAIALVALMLIERALEAAKKM